jgi:sugar phosphate isomerase/epimerase
LTQLSYILVDSPDSWGSFENFAAALRQIREFGFQGIEITISGPDLWQQDRLLEFVDSHDFPVVSLLTGSNYFQEGLCLCSPDEQVRRSAVERLQHYTSIAARFDALLVIGQMQGFPRDEPDQAVAKARIEESLKRITEAAEDRQVTVVLEPVNHLQVGFHHHLQDVLDLTRRIGSNCLRPMLDSFHMNIEETSLTEPILRAGTDLAHFHLCESNGSLLGSGNLDFPPIFQALESTAYAKWISVKVYRQPWARGAEAAVEHLRKLQLIP